MNSTANLRRANQALRNGIYAARQAISDGDGQQARSILHKALATAYRLEAEKSTPKARIIFAVCPVCKTTVRVRKDGLLWKHQGCSNQNRVAAA